MALAVRVAHTLLDISKEGVDLDFGARDVLACFKPHINDRVRCVENTGRLGQMLHRVRIVALLDSLLHISGFWEWIDAATSNLLLLAVVSLLSAWHLDGQRALLL